jgi:serine/threonine protein kinase
MSGTGMSTPRQTGGRDTFAADELAIVLSHFDIGTIDSIVEFPRGSRKAPKLLIVSEQGKFLLKRRARGKDDPFKVAFCHALQLFLAGKQFPLPHLIGTRKENNSMLQWRNTVYEMFEFIPGQNYPQTLESTFDSGRILALQPLLGFLFDSYRHAADMVDRQGLDNWPKQIVHADWHPGNMLFRENRVVAVIDYDSARLLPRIIDTANGCLQFSIIGGDEDVAKWPDYLDENRYKRFLKGYDDVMLVSQGEISVIPWLMIEALIAEAVFPIAATGTFVRIDGVAFLQMVQRKVYWMQRNAERMIQLAEA